jgi:TolB-like protein/Tfp pilus assembly protein PilF
MQIWAAEIKELEKLFESIKGQFPDLDKELVQLIRTEDANVVLLYSRRCLEVIISDLCECELKRSRKTEPLQGIIDKLNKEEKAPSYILTSMSGLNSLSNYGAHPKEFDTEQVKPVLNNLTTIIKWYKKHKESHASVKEKEVEEETQHGKPVKHLSKEERNEVLSISEKPILQEKSIAVLPFVDMSQDKDQDYFCDGITEEIINALSHIESFKVIARTSSFAFKGKQADIREIGRTLDVETLLEGSIRKDNNRLRIMAQLVKVSDGSHIWSERFDRDLKDVFAIQDEISLAIADNLKIKLLGETKKAMFAKRHTENIEAYNLYLKGTYYFQLLTAKGFSKASEYFELALQKDPDYAPAYVGLAKVNVQSTLFGNVSPTTAYPRAIEYVNKVLKIDSTIAEVYWVLGNIHMYYYWNWKEAEKNFKHAIQINPNPSILHLGYSFLLTFTGRHEEAISEAKRAQELDPLSVYTITYTGVAYTWSGQYDKALEEYQMSLAINSDYFLTRFHLGNLYFSKRMIKESIAEFTRAVDLSEGNPFATAAIACGCILSGREEQSDKLYESLIKRSETEYVPATSFFLIHMFKREEDRALEWLKKACVEHDTFLPWLKDNPVYFPEGSKYLALLREVGLRD